MSSEERDKVRSSARIFPSASSALATALSFSVVVRSFRSGSFSFTPYLFLINSAPFALNSSTCSWRTHSVLPSLSDLSLTRPHFFCQSGSVFFSNASNSANDFLIGSCRALVSAFPSTGAALLKTLFAFEARAHHRSRRRCAVFAERQGPSLTASSSRQPRRP